MAKLLHVVASPRGPQAYSTRVAEAFLEGYREAFPADAIDTLDLWDEELPRFDATRVSAKMALMQGDQPGHPEVEAWRQVEAHIDRFKAADKVLVSTPMWNFSIPYVLKQYFDVIVQPGHTFTVDAEKGYVGLVTGRPAQLILASGGEYSSEPAARFDFQEPYLKMIFGFIGFTDIRSLTVRPTALGRRRADLALQQAATEARNVAAEFA